MRFVLFIIALIAMVVVALTSCQAEKADGLTVLSWNVEALFDGPDDGIEYEEYRALGGWNEDKYRARLTAISKALSGAVLSDKAAGYPDVAVFIELENERVLDDLAADNPKAAYTEGFFSKRPGQALGTGVLSRYPVKKALSHGYMNGGETTPRPISEVWIEAEDGEFVILVCHWKSKLGKPEDTQRRRRDAAALVRRLTLDILADKPETPVLLAGDFNQTIDEFFEDDYPFLVTRDKALFTEGAPLDEALYYSPWGTELNGGSYFYKGAWESIDHFFLSGAFFDGKGWDLSAVALPKDAPWTGANGLPVSYNPKTGAGLSDHLPLLLKLKRTEGEG
jgi:hypothetical protein